MNEQQAVCRCSVKIDHLSIKKGNQVILSDVSLQANHGEILALIGRNGSGKTTLLKAILGRVSYSGTISFFNRDRERIVSPRIGYVPQTLIFDRNTPVTVLDLFCANSSSFPVWFGHRKKQANHLDSLLKKVGAQQHLHKKIGQLSGGELQRILLAFALDPIPDILLLDEPVSAVDRKGISLFYEMVTSMRNEYHMPIILVSHDLGHVQKYATKAALIDKTVITLQPSSQILKNKAVRETFGLDIDGGEW